MKDYFNPEYELRWPKDLFVREAGQVNNHDAATILIEDAFVNGAELVADARDGAPVLVDDLLANADSLPERSLGRPYWSRRETGSGPDTLSFHDREQGTETPPAEETTLVIIGESGREIGLAVDHVIGEEDIVIKSIAENYKNVSGIAGASILGDGRVSLILDVAALIEMVSKATVRGAC